MEHILQPVDTPSSLILYRDNQEILCTDFDQLSEILVTSLFKSNQDHRLMTNWTNTKTHPLIFEIPLKESTEKNTYDFLMRYFDLVFLDVFRKYINLPEVTLLLAMGRNQTSGLRIHVVGVEVAHDDYIHLCKLMRSSCNYHEEDLSVFLDTPSNFPLPSCARPNGDIYLPVRLVHAQFGLYQENGVWRTYRLKNVTRQRKDTDSFFNQMVNHLAWWKEVARSMIPYPQPNAMYLHFPTRIIDGQDQDNLIHIAQFTSYLNNQHYNIKKETVLTKGKAFCYDFWENNANQINLIHAFDKIHHTWYGRFRQISPYHYFHAEKQNISFQDIDVELKKLCPHLKENPLATVLAAYERPVYYALCNLTKDADAIKARFPFLSKDLPLVPPQEASHLTFDTILYCAYRTGESSFFTQLGTGFDWIVGTTTTLQHVIDHVLWFQRRAFPIVHGPEWTYSWDPITEKWLVMQEQVSEIMDILQAVVDIVTTYAEVSPELVQSFKDDVILNSVANQIIRESRTLEVNSMTESPAVYGSNVPEYYFLNLI